MAERDQKASSGIGSINQKSTIIMARKFNKDFNQSILLITEQGN